MSTADVINAASEHNSSLRDSRLRRAGLVIPTYNAERLWGNLQAALDAQGVDAAQILIVDSSSTDRTRELARCAGYSVFQIGKKEFGHGRTRKIAAEQLPWAEILVFMTQDAVPCESDCLKTLLCGFDDPGVGAIYGRQIPRMQAGPIERHARLFNYQPFSYMRDYASRQEFGFKTIFFSNSFAAYRHSAFDEVGGFSTEAIVSEEVAVVAQMLMAGWKIGYCAEACVEHSHNLSLGQEFRRFFDIAVEHEREGWLLDVFGTAGNQGRKFVFSQLKYLQKHDRALIPYALLRNAGKLLAYKLGINHRRLPMWLKQHLSAQLAHR